jgi:polyketide synthase 12/myxalamid-type polyketide synthase MxaB
LARRDLDERLAALGTRLISPEAGLAVLERLLTHGPQVGVLSVDWDAFFAGFGVEAIPPFFADLAAETRERVKRASSAAPSRPAQAAAPARPRRSEFLERYESADAGARTELLRRMVREQAGKVLGWAPSKALDFRQPLSDLGLDSLMAVELRNALGRAVERTLPATLLFEYPTLDEVAGYLACEVLRAEPHGEPKTAETAPARDLDDLSEQEMADLLEKKLDRADRERAQ